MGNDALNWRGKWVLGQLENKVSLALGTLILVFPNGPSIEEC